MIAGPGAIRDSLLDLTLDDNGKLGRGASDTLAELAAPSLPVREHRRRQRERAQVGEQGAHLFVDDERVTALPAVAASTTGLAISRSLSSTSTNDLNSPLSPAL